MIPRAVAIAYALLLAAGCSHQVQPIRQFAATTEPMREVAWSADSKLVAFGASDGALAIFDAGTGVQIAKAIGFVPHEMFYYPTGLAFSPDGHAIAFGTDNGAVRVWDFVNGSSRDLAPIPGRLLAAKFSGDGRRLVVACGGLVYPGYVPARRPPPPEVQSMVIVTYSVPDGTIQSRVDAPGFVNITFSPNSEFFAGARFTATSATTWPLRMSATELKAEGFVDVCNTSDGSRVQRFAAMGGLIYFSPDGKLLRSGSTVWDVHTGAAVCRIGDIDAKAFVGPSRLLAIEPGPPPFSLWPVAMLPTSIRVSSINAANGSLKSLGEYKPPDIERAFEHPAQFSPDGKLAVDRTMNLWAVPH